VGVLLPKVRGLLDQEEIAASTLRGRAEQEASDKPPWLPPAARSQAMSLSNALTSHLTPRNRMDDLGVVHRGKALSEAFLGVVAGLQPVP